MTPLISPLSADPAYAPIVREFAEEAAGTIERLRNARMSNEFETIEGIVHQLKSAATLGFPQITEAATACLKILRGKSQPEEIDAPLASLIELLGAVEG